MTDLAHPDYWLVISLEWPENSRKRVAECLFATVPQFLPDLGKDVAGVLAQTEVAYRNYKRPVLFFADVTKSLGAGMGWEDMGVNWNEAVRVLTTVDHIAGYFMEASEEAFMLASTNASQMIVPDRGGYKTIDADYQRSIVRSLIAAELKKHWPSYIAEMRAAGRVIETRPN